ncbi:DUF2690 domain-containing protein [Streptomyces albireticuli]|uniref:DUF2690 domain-containing protein n=1 Tax=Streptomyces albireticuli TaxID=1940 RepID=A0A2A2DBJ5_9ACTN|nr:DUF2690 domain-containing protein [Streptomyces albireticuli]MCD9145495.1 YjfA family protein [Streptomyces albireticuli]MCD9164940.1 YjfA family protein [Streptomyces albireticuli]MCD9195469.1 YjfA family protein [Streptomyces albireticuli]PAU48749.1 hypothetical protein CK936_11955 [Streptomyces albireticuli]
MNARRSALATATGLLVLSTAGWAPAAPAAPAPKALVTCEGASCDGADPNQTGCASGRATTLESKSYLGRTIRLRYNPDCRAAWAQLTEGKPGDDALVQDDQGLTYHRSISSGTDTYSPMVSNKDPRKARACVTVPGSGQSCTGYH